MSAVTLKSVRRTYGAETAVSDVSLTAPQGKLLALLGPSGSGKSTILRLIAGLEPVDAGEIRFGADLVSTSRFTLPAEQRRVGMVFQDYALFPHLSVGANVAFGLNTMGKAAREETALGWLDRVGLRRKAHAYPHELSGGEQQRVALARALAPSPRAVLLDEPFSGLDPVLRAELRDATVVTLAESGATTLLVTHDAEDALQTADKIAILKEGRVLQEAPPREAYERPACLDAAAALGPINVFDAVIVGGAAITPFGAVTASHLPEAARVKVAVRAEALRLRNGEDARVLDVRPHGANDLVRIEAQGVTWRALAPAGIGLGAAVAVDIHPIGAFVFADKSLFQSD